MFNTISHQYSQYANKVLDWLPSDDIDQFERNMENNYDILKENNWLDKRFNYSFNSHGFRSDEFTLDPSIMFLGCSHTCGIGLPITDTWAYIVSKNLNLTMINLGIGGTGPDTSFRLANHYVHQLQPKIVVYFEPSDSRFCLYQQKGFVDFTPNNHEQYKDFYNMWALNDENLILNGIKHKLAIEAICYKNNVKLIMPNVKDFGVDALARDLLHAGVEANKLFSEKVTDLINKIE